MFKTIATIRLSIKITPISNDNNLLKSKFKLNITYPKANTATNTA